MLKTKKQVREKLRITDIYGYKLALKISSALSAGVFFDELSKFSEVGVIKYLWGCKKCGRHAPWVLFWYFI
jgi:hypothetical protein